MIFQIFSLLFLPLLVLSEPESDNYLFIHLLSNRSTGGEVRNSDLLIYLSQQVDLDVHPAQLGEASKSPQAAGGNKIRVS